jgi:hypothetical protein
VKVSVDTLLQLSDDSSISKKQNEVSNAVEDEDTMSLKDCICKYSGKQDVKEDEPLPSQKRWPGGDSKGKCKVPLSVDGLGGGKVEQADKKRK